MNSLRVVIFPCRVSRLVVPGERYKVSYKRPALTVLAGRTAVAAIVSAVHILDTDRNIYFIGALQQMSGKLLGGNLFLCQIDISNPALLRLLLLLIPVI